MTKSEKKETYLAPDATAESIFSIRVCDTSGVSSDNIDSWTEGNENWF